MEIVLLKPIKSLGNPGDIKEVKRGYAVNYLIPQGFALPAKKGFIKEAQARIRKIIKARKAELEEIKKVIEEIKDLEIIIYKKASKEGKLFGSVREKDIVSALAEKINKQIDEKYVILEKPIKEIGEYEIEIGAEEAKTKIKVKVEKERK